MMPELGQFSLILALLLAAVQGVVPIVGAWRGNPSLMGVARPAAVAQAVFVAAAFLILTYGFVTFDFSIAYVADNSNLALPWYYRVAAVWGAHEGSLLLWILILNLWTVALAIFSRQLSPAFAARVLGVLGLVAVGFLAFIVGALGDLEFDRKQDVIRIGRDHAADLVRFQVFFGVSYGFFHFIFSSA